MSKLIYKLRVLRILGYNMNEEWQQSNAKILTFKDAEVAHKSIMQVPFLIRNTNYIGSLYHQKVMLNQAYLSRTVRNGKQELIKWCADYLLSQMVLSTFF